MTIGQELAETRRKLGLSLDDISAKTKVSVERLSAIEACDAEQLPSLVYLKGFVRAYAKELNLDADEVADRYVASLDEPAGLLESNQTVSRAIVPTAEESIAAFDSEDPSPLPMRVSAPASRLFVFAPDVADDSTESFDSVATPPPVAAADPPIRRVAPLVIASALAVLGGYLVSANFDRIRGDRSAPAASRSAADGTHAAAPQEGTPAPAARDGKAAPDAVTTSAPREPSTRPEARPTPPIERTPAAGSKASIESKPSAASTPSTAPKSSPAPAVESRAVKSKSPGGAARVPEAFITVPGSPAGARTAPASGAAAATEAVPAADEVSGSWNVTTEVEPSAAGNDVALAFQLTLEQRGNRVVGRGFRTVGGAEPAGSRIPITVDGTLNSGRLTLTLVDQAGRAIGGRMVLFQGEDGAYRGRFKDDALPSSRLSVARREAAPRN